MSPAEQASVCAAARSYIDTPWLGQGRSRMGIDCCGVPVMAFRDAGFTVEEGRVDYTALDPKRMLATLLKHCRQLDANEKPQAADIIVYGLPQLGHVAILVDGKYGLNAVHSPQYQRVIEARFDPARGVVKGIYRWRGTE